MKLKTKILIFTAAVLLSFVLFSLISSPTAVEMVKTGKRAGYQIISNIVG
ncbi:MAG: hypothetical protein JXB26_15700 [Candidatus Aminicenantes bacterium]|nr:hypothetical protein [Candidatus Aminicenantes bacterium]